MKTMNPKPQKPFRLTLGVRGEMMAWAYLARSGYKIIEKNYRCPLGEIDCIAAKQGRTAFIEIKTRSDHRFGRPEESVHPRKQKKLVQLAQWYLKGRQNLETKVSFDVLAITWGKGTEPEFRLIENAFGADRLF